MMKITRKWQWLAGMMVVLLVVGGFAYSRTRVHADSSRIKVVFGMR